MAWQTILFEAADGVASLTLNRPDRLNSFTAVMHEEVADVLGVVESDAAIRARERKSQADHRSGAHRAPDVEVKRIVTAGRDVIGRRTDPGNDHHAPAIGQQARDEFAAVHR